MTKLEDAKFKWFRPLLAALLLALPAWSRAAEFDGARALKLIEAQCAFGPRIPGTPAQIQGRDWIESQVKSLGMAATVQPFETTLPLTGAHVKAWNIWASAKADGPTSPAIVISAHWDTRPYADQDPLGGRRHLLGANDGGSGVAMALELARDLQGDPLRDHLVLAFWDAEDSGTPSDLESWALGAAYAAKHPPAWIDRVVLGINLDMVGGADLALRRETQSIKAAPKAVEGIWTLGMAMTPGRFVDEEPFDITDDHLPWIRAGVPWVDLIGFPYKYWHTASDSPEHCSADAMGRLGAVLLQYLRLEDWKTQGRALPVKPQPLAPAAAAAKP